MKTPGRMVSAIEIVGTVIVCLNLRIVLRYTFPRRIGRNEVGKKERLCVRHRYGYCAVNRARTNPSDFWWRLIVVLNR